MRADIYTYPILGVEGHFVNGSFSVILEEIVLGEDFYKFQFIYELDEPTINAHIASGNACVAVSVRNRAFYYRVFEFSDKNKLEVSIPIEQIGIDFLFIFTPFVLVKRSINAYVNTNADAVRSRYSYNLEPGNKLAVADDIKVSFDERYELFNNGGSFIKIRQSDSEDKMPQLEIKSHAIYLILNKMDFKEVSKVNNSPASEILLSSLAWPVVMNLLWSIKSGDLAIEDLDWGPQLMEEIDRAVVEEIDPFMDSQELLSNPLFKGAEKINHLIYFDDEDRS